VHIHVYIYINISTLIYKGSISSFELNGNIDEPVKTGTIDIIKYIKSEYKNQHEISWEEIEEGGEINYDDSMKEIMINDLDLHLVLGSDTFLVRKYMMMISYTNYKRVC
jgi:hypothetical protein